jgi:HEAT repeat protein
MMRQTTIAVLALLLLASTSLMSGCQKKTATATSDEGTTEAERQSDGTQEDESDAAETEVATADAAGDTADPVIVDEIDLKKLIGDVGSEDSQVCMHAVDALGELGADAAEAVPALVEALQRNEPEVCWHICRTLGAIGEDAKSAVPALAKLLKDENAHVRGYAAFALGRMGKAAEPVADALIENAFDEDPLVRRATLRALRAIDPPQEKTLPVVIRILEEGDMTLILPALSSLAEQGKDAVPRLRKALEHEKAQYWACVVLSDIGPDAADAVADIAKVLDVKDPDTRLQALLALGNIGEASKVVSPAIIEVASNDEFPHVRYAAVYALGEIGISVAAAEQLKAWMKSDDAFLRVVSAWAVGRNYQDDKDVVGEAVATIVNAFESEDVDVRRAAARAMVEFDVDPETVAPLLVKALQDEDDTVVANAIDALSAFGPRALKHMDSALANKELRHYALLLIRRMGAEAATAVPAIVDALGKADDTPQDVEFTREAQIALSAIGPEAKAAIPALIKSLASADDEVRASACYALGKMGEAARSAIPALQRAEEDESLVVQAASVFALWEVQPGDATRRLKATALLLKALESDRELVRAGAATMLGELGTVGDTAKEKLKQVSENDDAQIVRDAAAEALKKLTD